MKTFVTVQHLITLVSVSSRSCPLRTYTGTNFVNSVRVEVGFLDEMARINVYAINCAVTVSIRGYRPSPELPLGDQSLINCTERVGKAREKESSLTFNIKTEMNM